MRIGMHRDYVFDRDELGGTVAFDRQMTGQTPRRCTRASKRRVGATSKFGTGSYLNRCAREFRNLRQNRSCPRALN